MSRHEEYMKSMMIQEELRMAQANKQSDNVVDMVNSPPHYNQTGIECIHAISAATDQGFKYYLQGNVMKYLWRFDYKDKPLEDELAAAFGRALGGGDCPREVCLPRWAEPARHHLRLKGASRAGGRAQKGVRRAL